MSLVGWARAVFLPFGGKAIHTGIVLGQLSDPVMIGKITTGVTDMTEVQGVFVNQADHHSGAHAGAGIFARGHPHYLFIGMTE